MGKQLFERESLLARVLALEHAVDIGVCRWPVQVENRLCKFREVEFVAHILRQ